MALAPGASSELGLALGVERAGTAAASVAAGRVADIEAVAPAEAFLSAHTARAGVGEPRTISITAEMAQAPTADGTASRGQRARLRGAFLVLQFAESRAATRQTPPRLHDQDVDIASIEERLAVDPSGIDDPYTGAVSTGGGDDDDEQRGHKQTQNPSSPVSDAHVAPLQQQLDGQSPSPTHGMRQTSMGAAPG